MRKQLDRRILDLINTSGSASHRSLFLLIGDKSRDQIVNLFWLQSQASSSSASSLTKRSNSVLWCYKDDLGFTSHRKKRSEKIKRDIKRGIRSEDLTPFEAFIESAEIRYCFYKDTHTVLGKTFGMLILQDFEAITPNILARTIETVQGGGTVVVLLNNMTSLAQVYEMSMDSHARFRSSLGQVAAGRFNERFLHSLSASEAVLVLDDELNVLPISAGKVSKSASAGVESEEQKRRAAELKEIKESMAASPVVGDLIALCQTSDQAKVILTLTDAITDRSLSSTVAITAARGRGKSAALGLAIASAVAHGYSNIFLTAPSPENLGTVFQFVLIGLTKLGYADHTDYSIVQSTNPDFKNALVRINVFRSTRQTVQFIQPQDAHVLGQAELLVIDEAAAIPLPLVRTLIAGNYLVFLSSTINGYEGTGRALSLKLIKQLREASRPSIQKPSHQSVDKALVPTAALTRKLKEVSLTESIRYSPNDPIESWLNTLLCLDSSPPSIRVTGAPHPSKCSLFAVDRDTLFSFHPASELFLQRMMSLYVSGHYKNSPNDLQLMSDAAAHRLFVLLPPIQKDDTSMPEPLVVIQVALEGKISSSTVAASLNRGSAVPGDLIPWSISRHFQDHDFASLSGARIVRIATHTDYLGMGYGARAMQELESFYRGESLNLDESAKSSQLEKGRPIKTVTKGTTLLNEQITIRDAKTMAPLLHRTSDLRPEKLDYLGVSFGMTRPLLKFWKRSGFTPLYIRLNQTDVTGEHSCIMLKSLGSEPASWLGAFAIDFRKRFLSLLSYKFREFSSLMALSILESIKQATKSERALPISSQELKLQVSIFDLKRLESYSKSLLEHHAVLDLIPTLAAMYFNDRMPDVKLSAVQSSLLLSLGLQHKSVDDLHSELDLPVSQCLALFAKVVAKFVISLNDLERGEISKSMPDERKQSEATKSMLPIKQSVVDELTLAGTDATSELKEMQKEMINALDMSKYALPLEGADWDSAQAHVSALAENPSRSSTITIPTAVTAVPKVPEKSSEAKSKRKGQSSNSQLSKKSKKT